MKSAHTFLSFVDPSRFHLTVQIHFLVRLQLPTHPSRSLSCGGVFPGPSGFRSLQHRSWWRIPGSGHLGRRPPQCDNEGSDAANES